MAKIVSKAALIVAAILLIGGCNIIDEEMVKEIASGSTEEAVTEIVTEATEIVTEPASSISGKIIVVDAGHGKNNSGRKEPIAPGSSEMKAGFVSGTTGKNQTEEQLNLAVALKLQTALEEKGAIVYMTRTTHETDMSNVDRAKLGNEVNADIAVRLHADGAGSSSAHGVSVLVPGAQYISDSQLISDSRRAGELVLEEFVKSTGAKNRGISVRNDMTGFNWSEVPVILVEMGFMTNPDEDKRMETDDYQNKMVEGIVNGLERYFE